MLYIVTLSKMKLDLGITDARDDAALTEWMQGLQARFEDLLGRKLLRSEVSDETHSGGESFLYLQRFPVEAVASIAIDGEQTSYYRLRKDRGIITYGSGGPIQLWPEGFQNISVTYTGGYVADGQTASDGQTMMPETIRRCFFIQAGFEWRNRFNLGKESISAQGTSVALAPAELLPEVRQGLQYFRRII